jgi:hypothetical protein
VGFLRESLSEHPILWIFAFVALFILGVVVISRADDKYVPLTIDQAKQYIQANPDAAAQDIVKLDWMEHQAPTANVPASILAVHGSDASIAWQGPLALTWGILEGIPIVFPMYSVVLSDETFKGVVKPEPPWWEWPAVIVAFIGGAAFGRAVR